VEEAISKMLVEPIRYLYALLWRLGLVEVDDEAV
jgi:hypothetical protein